MSYAQWRIYPPLAKLVARNCLKSSRPAGRVGPSPTWRTSYAEVGHLVSR